MRTGRCAVILLLLLAATVIGCAQPAVSVYTLADKQQSFAAYESATIAGAPIEQFLHARLALVLNGVDVSGDPSKALADRLKPRDPNDLVGIGSAVPIEPDGYFLTAAHCVTHGPGPVQVLFVARDGPAVARARVVWLGVVKPDEPEDDLALLHVDGPARPRACYTWATDAELVPGATVFTDGAYGPAAGMLLAHVPTPSGHWPTTARLHTAPLVQGDSGGPLLLANGRLVGVNASAVDVRGTDHRSRGGFYADCAVRPDSEWLTKVIATDRSTRAANEVQRASPRVRATPGEPVRYTAVPK